MDELPALEGMADVAAPSDDKKVPVTIVTGFLGSGKSTLLRRILQENHGKRIAVIENEFGDDVGIESLILKQGLGQKVADGFFELSNGCICCSVKDALVDTIEKVMRQRHKFDYVLVETSGMAHPGPVAAAFWSDAGAADTSMLQLDAIVTVVDAAAIGRTLRDPRPDGAVREAEQQIACADVILLNKIDTVGGEAAVQDTISMLKSMNGSAIIMPCTHCAEPPLDSFIGIAAFNPARLLSLASDGDASEGSGAGAGSSAGDAHMHDHHEHHDGCGCGDSTDAAAATAATSTTVVPPPRVVLSSSHAHDSGIRTVLLRLPASQHLDISKFEAWMGGLLWEAAGEDAPVILRGKGVLLGAPEPAAADGDSAAAADDDNEEGKQPQRYIFQSVCEQMEVEAATGAASSSVALCESRIILIGRHLRQAELQAALAACAAS